MPFGDGTGPRGEGPRTGRGPGRGFGRGFGPGRRFAGVCRSLNPNNRGYWRPHGPIAGSQEEARETEREYLANEIEFLEEELEAMKERLRELSGKT
ncbi:MAG: DUF5320 family protein [Candidatus Bipolaricaulia bacterium]